MENTDVKPEVKTTTNVHGVEYVYVMDGEVHVPYTLEPGATAPEYKTAGAAGMDICASEDVDLLHLIPTLVKTGIRMSIPAGFEAQVRPRSGLALKGVTVLNTPGTIDSDYRGEIGVILIFITPTNLAPFKIKKGDRIAQLVFQKVQRAVLDARLFLDETDRGAGGFGHTGV